MAKVGNVGYRVLRSAVSRPNIAYSVYLVRDVDASVKAVVGVVKKKLAPGESVIVFCLSRSDAEKTARCLNVPYYHARCEEDRLQDVLSGLREGRHWGVAATSLLSVGFDVPNVRYVVHHGRPRL